MFQIDHTIVTTLQEPWDHNSVDKGTREASQKSANNGSDESQTDFLDVEAVSSLQYNRNRDEEGEHDGKIETQVDTGADDDGFSD